MVLKRRLPSAMASEETKKEEVKASPSAAPKEKPAPVSFDDIPDEQQAKAVPLAPEPETDVTESAMSKEAPVEDTAPAKEIPENDFDVQELETPTSVKEEPTQAAPVATSWDEEPEVSSAGGWEIDDLGDASPSNGDVFSDMAEEVGQKEEPVKSSEKLPPWQQGAAANEGAPELPSDIAAAAPTLPSAMSDKAKPAGALVGILLLVGIGFGIYKFFIEKDEATEVISRWTGSLNEVSEEIPTGDSAANSSGKTGTMLEPESVVTMGNQSDEVEVVSIDVSDSSQPMEDEIAPESVIGDVDSDAQTVVEFVDVPENEVEKPIDAEEAGEMPKEVGMIVQLQQAITAARKEKNPDNYKEVAPEPEEVEVGDEVAKTEEEAEEEALEMLSPEELDERNNELSRQLDAELAEYRRILAGDSTEKSRKVKPSEFFKGKEEGANVDKAATAGSIPLPKRESSLLSQKQAESFYGANPYNLPVVSEPSAQPTKTVRTLSDFDVSMFQIEREQVRIPENIKPTFRATDFPPLILLSIVRGKGIIAEVNHKQGVLLIGESVSGWELIQVKEEYAEFSNGKRKHIINIGR